MMKLMGFQFEIHYHLRLENKAVDSLSRISHSATLLALAVSKVVQLDQLAQEVEKDAYLQGIIRELQHDPSSWSDFQLVDD